MIGVRHVPHRLFTPIFRITLERALTQRPARGNIASSKVRLSAPEELRRDVKTPLFDIYFLNTDRISF